MRSYPAAVPLAATLAGSLLLISACGSSSKSAAAAIPTGSASAAPSGVFGSTDPSSGPSSAEPSSAPSTASASASAALPGACSLLTPAEAQAVAGTPLMAPVAAGGQTAATATLCQFTGPTSGPTAQVEVYVGDGAKKQLDIERALKHTFTTVPGVGDQCVQEDGYIFVEKNGIWASIHLVRLNDPALNVKPLQTGIKAVAARLP